MPKKVAKKATPKPIKKKAAVIKTVSYKRLPGVIELSRSSLNLLWAQRYTILGIILIYGAVNLAVAQGFNSGLSVTSAKAQLNSLFHGHLSNLGGNLTIYALMLGSIGGTSSSNGFGYTLLFAVLASLAVIWTIRNSASQPKNRVLIRDAYYRGMYPLIPFILILLLIGIELLPMLAGISLYVTAINNSIAITAIEKLGFIVLMILLSALSFFLLSSSIFALYIVTLPDMNPMKALRSARDLVRKRRLMVLLRLLFLPLALLVLSALIMLPFIAWAAAAASWAFFVLSLLMLALANGYIYNLYRELLLL